MWGMGSGGSCVICLNQCIDIAAILLYNVTNQLVFEKEEVMTKQEIKSTQTKQAILKAAEEEFSEKGIYGARVDEIAAKAKINKGMIYQYFGNKEELYKTVLKNVYDRLGDSEDLVICNQKNCISEITDLVRTYFYFLRDNPSYVRMVMWENLNYGYYFQEKELGDVKNPIRLELGKIMEEGKKAGEISEQICEEDIFQTLIACSFNYFSNRWTLKQILKKDLGKDDEIERRIKQVTKMVVSYIKKD